MVFKVSWSGTPSVSSRCRMSHDVLYGHCSVRLIQLASLSQLNVIWLALNKRPNIAGKEGRNTGDFFPFWKNFFFLRRNSYVSSLTWSLNFLVLYFYLRKFKTISSCIKKIKFNNLIKILANTGQNMRLPKTANFSSKLNTNYYNLVTGES